MSSGTDKTIDREWLARIVAFAGVCLVLAFYAWVQVSHFTPAYCEDDPDGYIYLAKQFATGAKVGMPDTDPFLRQNHVWVTNHRGELLPKFTPGYAWLMAPFYRYGGDVACFYVSPIMGGLTLLGAYLLFRLWVPRLPSLCGMAALAFNGMFLAYCGFLLTHATDMAATTWGMYFLWRWRKQPGILNALGAGLCLGFAVTVRPANALMVLALLAAGIPRLLEDWRAGGIRWRVFVALGAAYSFFPVLWMIYNAHMFGHPLRSGYALTDEQGAFSLRFILNNIGPYTHGLSDNLFLVFPLGLLGLFAFGSKRDRFMRAAWFWPLVVLYWSYYWPYNNFASLRFLLPVFPLIVGAAFGLIWEGTVSTARLRSVLTVALALLIVWSDRERAVSVFRNVTANESSRRIARFAELGATHLRNDAVIFGMNPACYHLGMRRNYQCYSLQAFEPAWLHRNGEGSCPRWQQARFDRWHAFYSGTSSNDLKTLKAQLISQCMDDGKQVAFIVPRDMLRDQSQALEARYTTHMLQETEFTDYDRRHHREAKIVWGLYEVVTNYPSGSADAAAPSENKEAQK